MFLYGGFILTILGINGKLRQGKGILLTNLALTMADAGMPVLSNYAIDHKNCKVIDFYDFIRLIKQPRAEQLTMLAIDEIQGWLDSYIGQSKSGRYGSYFIFQSAKLGYEIGYTTQLTMRAQNTLRELADYRIYAKKDATNKEFYYFWLDPNVTDDDVPTGAGFKITYEQASTWWDKYDTFEAVAPAGINEFFDSLLKSDPKRKNERINQQVELLCEQKFYIEPTRIGVESALLQLQQSTIFSPLVAHRYKLQQRNKHTQELQKKGKIGGATSTAQRSNRELLQQVLQKAAVRTV